MLDTVQIKLEAYCDRLALCETLEDLHDFLDWLKAFLEVEHVAYHAISRNKNPLIMVTYSPEWSDYYMDEEFHKIDPVVQNAFMRFQPYDWKSLSWTTKAARGMLAEAIDGGVGDQGLSVPIRGPSGDLALFTINHRTSDLEWLRFCESHMHVLLLIAHYLHQKTRAIEHYGEVQSTPSLSPRERDALTYLGAGRNRGQAAQQLAISEHTLRVYIESARYKLGAANTVSAVARAASMGLIQI
ncbi:LuxR family transcriptional regulator [Amylibacter sp. SFDW26]|uniref:helix-turn-helix transcriptional regulator n=1 Tax=Amylibacter sp. SFDW26 TaxID=2652722 RepID=UPI001D029467|nr:LuxR family transcriptional regulator [Amylibacter sp. SFDW26]